MKFSVVVDNSNEVLIYNHKLDLIDSITFDDIISSFILDQDDILYSTSNEVYTIYNGYDTKHLEFDNGLNISHIEKVNDTLIISDFSKGIVFQLLPNDEKIIHISKSGMNDKDNITSIYHNKKQNILYYTYSGKVECGKIVREDGEVVWGNLFSPYDYQIYNNTEYLCESGVNRVVCRSNNEEDSIVVEGSPRGLVVNDDHIYVGESILTPAKISMYDRNTLQKIDEVVLPNPNKEIIEMRIINE